VGGAIDAGQPIQDLFMSNELAKTWHPTCQKAYRTKFLAKNQAHCFDVTLAELAQLKDSR
jgi:hypothetical protein